MKKIFLFLILLTVMICGCTKTYQRLAGYTDVLKYEEGMEELNVYNPYISQTIENNSSLLPASSEEFQIEYFVCEVWECFPIGEAYQAYVVFRYNERDSYEKEIIRISQIQNDKPIVYDQNTFLYPAYIALLNHIIYNEYVLADEEELKIIYVNYCFLDLDELIIPERYLSKSPIEKDIDICIYRDD